jgi:hypothetical protein
MPVNGRISANEPVFSNIFSGVAVLHPARHQLALPRKHMADNGGKIVVAWTPAECHRREAAQASWVFLNSSQSTGRCIDDAIEKVERSKENGARPRCIALLGKSHSSRSRLFQKKLKRILIARLRSPVNSGVARGNEHGAALA